MHELKSAMNSYKKKALLTAVLQMTLMRCLTLLSTEIFSIFGVKIQNLKKSTGVLYLKSIFSLVRKREPFFSTCVFSCSLPM